MRSDLPKSYIDPSQEAGRAFLGKAHSGPIVMLNLLRFRRVADYAAYPNLAPASPISGAEAYERYVAHTLPFLKESGGEVTFLGRGGNFLIGPSDERWDAVALIRQSSVASFMAFASNAEYMQGIGHRAAALEDSRLLPIYEQGIGELFGHRKDASLREEHCVIPDPPNWALEPMALRITQAMAHL